MRILLAVIAALLLSMGTVSADTVWVEIDGQIVGYESSEATEDDLRDAVAKFGLPPTTPSESTTDEWDSTPNGDYSDGDSIADMNRVKKYKEFAASLPF